MNLESKRPPRPLFRVGRDDDAWAVPDWAYAKEDGTFGNRFDDPMRVYRVSCQAIRVSILMRNRYQTVDKVDLVEGIEQREDRRAEEGIHAPAFWQVIPFE